ncbi:hypothetical protein [Polyangium sp. y55x31]|uniref:hypothetical protein n=1 Tax=Polyangium sp. y55x31 TaxID=3042688 RepID=UPI002482BED8|nr:hypothetical protein [Polyangium sp. y55x31]MDI1478789.1 hypothetical protein [Polyangium sp. y55x31]
MRVRRKPRHLLAAVLGVLAGSVASACGTDAVGIDACREIETARCEALPACGGTEAEATYCIDLYRDQCLHGIQSGVEPGADATARCVEAVRAVAACARAGAASMADCPAEPLVAAADPAAITPCVVITRRPEQLADCAFVASTADAGATPPATDASDGGDATTE